MKQNLVRFIYINKTRKSLKIKDSNKLFMTNTTSQHILNTSANLLGFCLFVITSFHITDKAEASMIDEFTSLIAMFLAFSCILSFLSIRSKKPKRKLQLEEFADYLFVISLSGILIIIVLMVFKFIK